MILQRILLGVLLLVFGTLQFHISADTVKLLVRPESSPSPPPGDLNAENMQFTRVGEAAKKAGVQVKDVLLAVGGVPVQSEVQAYHVFSRYNAGQQAELTIRRGTGQPFQVQYALPKSPKQTPAEIVLIVTINFLIPWIALILGFLVAFLRTGDSVAYALLALMLGVSQMLKANPYLRYSWNPALTTAFLFLDVLVTLSLAAAWTWFAIQFPDPKSSHRVLPTAFRWFAPVYLLWVVVQAFENAISQTTIRVFDRVYHLLQIPDPLITAIVIAFMALGFANFINKLVKEKRPDQRRRLRWVLAGLSVGILPVVAAIIWTQATAHDFGSIPMWLLLPIVLTPILIPITLGYAVLVGRLFDVGVVIRQGLLASRFVDVIRVLLLFTLAYIMAESIKKKDIGQGRQLAEIAGCAVAILGVRRGSVVLRKWVDRRYFRESVNAEQILTDLSSEVRRIADPQLLIRTVIDRIAAALHVTGIEFFPAYAGLPFDAPMLSRLRVDRQPIQVDDRVLLPIATGEDLHGVVTLGPKKSEEPYSGSDLRLLESVANQTALALDNSRLAATIAEEAAHRERLTSELEIARQVQERLFPKTAPKVEGLDLAGCCQPAQTVGGDYFDFLVTPEGSVGLAIGDVAGKGVPAALLMAGLQASLRGLMAAGLSDPADLMTRLNTLVYDASPANRFATFWFGLYDPSRRLLRYSVAGHNPALLLRPGEQRAIWLKTPGVALGLRRKSQYGQAEVELVAGDRLVLYTDGISEARNLQGDEFGEEGLLAAVAALPEGSAKEVMDELIAKTEAFAGEAPQHDDITVIVGRVVS